jgi:hypothetical protein
MAGFRILPDLKPRLLFTIPVVVLANFFSRSINNEKLKQRNRVENLFYLASKLGRCEEQFELAIQ